MQIQSFFFHLAYPFNLILLFLDILTLFQFFSIFNQYLEILNAFELQPRMIHRSLGGHFTVFQAQVLAIDECIQGFDKGT